MKTLTSTAIAAILTTAIGLGAIAPAAAAGPGFHQQQHGGERHFGPRGGMQGLFDLSGGGEAVEIALVRLSHRIELTAEQQPLFDTLRNDALAAADTFETATADLVPGRGAREDIDFADRLDAQIAIGKARIAALEAIKPAATAFFDSLDADQLKSLTGGRDGHRGPGQRGPRPDGEAPADRPAPTDEAPQG